MAYKIGGDCGIASLLVCPMCMKQDGDPKQLPCGHSVCCSCVKDLLQNTRKNAPQSKYVLCPLCRENIGITAAGPDTLPTNVTLTQLRDDPCVLGAEKYNKPCQLCPESGNKKVAKMFCMDCGKNCCDACKTVHKQRAVFNNHQLVAMSNIVCKEHESNMEYFCDNCNFMLCGVCIQSGKCDEHGNRIKKIATLNDKGDHQEEIEYVINELKKDERHNRKHYQPTLLPNLV